MKQNSKLNCAIVKHKYTDRSVFKTSVHIALESVPKIKGKYWKPAIYMYAIFEWYVLCIQFIL